MNGRSSPDVPAGDRPGTAPSATARERPHVGLGVVTGILTLVLALASVWHRCVPPVTEALQLQVRFPSAGPGQVEPLVVTGRFGEGDFLAIAYVDAEHARLTYDAWGSGGPASVVFSLDRDRYHRLRVALPSLGSAGGALQVALDGRPLLAATVAFHRAGSDALYFGVNPIGGTPAARFRGELRTETGARLTGAAAGYFPASARLAWGLRHQTPWFIGAGVLSVVAGWLVSRIPWTRWFRRIERPAVAAPPSTRAPHGTFALVLVLCVGVFAAVVTGGTGSLLYPDSFGTFYDYQASSLLHGRLDVPDAALGGEAFVVAGKVYGYFGPTPALLRLPFAVLGVGFGRLTRLFLIIDFTACLGAAYALLVWATRERSGPGGWPSRWATALVLGTAGLGSTLFFLSSRAYVYHEAILCGAALALWSAYASLRYLREPTRRWWLGAVLLGLLAVHARPPAGLFALFLLGCVALVHLFDAVRRREPNACRGHAGVGLAALVAVLSFSGLSYLKFGTLDGSPLRYNVQYTPERLARFDGRNFHLENLPHNFDAYFLQRGFHLRRAFPFVAFGAAAHRSFPEAKIDLEEPCAGLPFVSAGLFWIALLGAGWAASSVRSLRRPIALLVVGVLPMTLAILTAIATSHRYSGDFVPVLLALAAVGLAAFDTERPRLRRRLLSTATLLTILSILVNVALTLQFAGEVVWGQAPEIEQAYRQLGRATGHPPPSSPDSR